MLTSGSLCLMCCTILYRLTVRYCIVRHRVLDSNMNVIMLPNLIDVDLGRNSYANQYLNINMCFTC